MEADKTGRELGAFAQVDETDAADFIQRLDRMHTLPAFQAYKSESFASMALDPAARVADIGCGTGEDAARLAQLVPQGKAIGVDLSNAMVEEAGRRFADRDNLEFRCAAAESLPFADGELDAIRADRVLIHVPDPAAAITEFLRVLKPGGRMVLSEPDMPGCWVSTADPQVSLYVGQAIATSCLHPYLPRDIGVLLRDMGFEDVEHRAIAMVSEDFATINHACQFELVAEGLKRAGMLPPERVQGWWDEQRARSQEGRFCAGLNVMTAVVTKPLRVA